MPDIFAFQKERFFECHSEILNFASNPSKKHGIEVVLIRDVDCYKKGQKGIVKQFNEVQLHSLHKEYSTNICFVKSKFPIPNLSNTYDFHPIVKREGKLEVSTWHVHLSRFDFISIKRVKQIK